MFGRSDLATGRVGQILKGSNEPIVVQQFVIKYQPFKNTHFIYMSIKYCFGILKIFKNQFGL